MRNQTCDLRSNAAEHSVWSETSCLLNFYLYSSEKEVKSKRKEFAPWGKRVLFFKGGFFLKEVLFKGASF